MESTSGRGFLMFLEGALSKRETQCLLAILLFGIVISLLLIKGPSLYGDDAAYLQYVPGILSGFFTESINIFSIRLMADFPLAFFIGIFGYTDFGAAAWSLLSYAVTLVAVYLMGKELYSARAGLLSALFFSFYPLILHFNTTPEPMLPMAMFVSLSALFFVYGRKRKSLGSYALSGAFAFIGTLANPLAYIYLLFYIVYVATETAYNSIRKRKFAFDFKALGILLGLFTAIAVIGYINLLIAPSSNPFYELSLTSYYYSAAGGPNEIFYTNPSLTFYLSGYFPYDISGQVLSPLLHLNLNAFVNGIEGVIGSLFSLTATNLNDVGLFGYATVLAGLYLLARRDRRSYFALAAASFIVAYMEFGSMSITHYFPIYKLMRFTVIAAPMLMLVLGTACASFISAGERRGRVSIYRAAVVAAIALILFTTSAAMDYYYYAFNHNSMQYVSAMADSMKQSNLTGTNFFAPAEVSYYLPFYLGYAHGINVAQYDNGAYGGKFMPTCASIPNRTYLLIPSNSVLQYINSFNLWNINESWASDPSICNLTLYADLYNDSAIANLVPISQDFTGNIYYKS